MIDGGPGPVLPRPFFARPAAEVAPDLLGLLLVARDVVVRLTEVEAYEPDDPASHSYIGRRPRNRVMFGPPGHLYVYRSYGIHWCANVVCAEDGGGAAVLLRAGEVCRGEAAALARRASAVGAPHLLCAGPGRLCAALAISGGDDGADLCDVRSPLRLAVPDAVGPEPEAGAGGAAAVRGADGGRPPWVPDPAVVCRTTRIGITKAVDAPLRWLELGNRTVSRPPARRSPAAGGPPPIAHRRSPTAPVACRAVAPLRPADLTPSAQLARARLEVAGALAGDAVVEGFRARMLAFVDAHPDALLRTCPRGHLTSSALVVRADRRHVLLLEHRKLRRWFQPGGHADGEANLAASALREATEESGIVGLRVLGPAIDLDIHEVRPPAEEAHDHLDVRYLVLAPPDAVAVHNHESTGQAWVTEDRLDGFGVDAGLRRLVHRGLAIAAELP